MFIRHTLLQANLVQIAAERPFEDAFLFSSRAAT
jgi:hypothetical protein